MRKTVCLFLCMLLTASQLFAQNRTIKGVVLDEKGVGLPDVTVSAKGSTSKTTTATNGSFSISVPANTKSLEFSYIGYNSVTESIPSSGNLSVSLTSASSNIDEVVVTGYQTVRKKDVIGSISTIAGKEIAEKPIANFTQLLQGKAAGVQVVGQSGRPGQNGYIRIRGTGSINASSEPLIIVDGIAVNSQAYSLINPNDIEDLTVLKDAAASSIYGSRAGNGVLVVTTKRGKSGKPELRYLYQRGFAKLQRLNNVQLMNAQQKQEYEFGLGYTNPILDSMITNRRGNSLPTTATLLNITPQQRQALWDLSGSRGVGDWTKEYLNQAAGSEQHELSLSGSSDKIRYFFSMNRLKEDGLLYKSFRDRTGGRLNVEYAALDWFKTGVNLSVAVTKEYQNREVFNAQNPWAGVYLANPYEPLRLPNGSINLTMQGFSPIEGQDNNPFIQDRISGFATVFGEATFLKNFKLKSLLALNYNTLKSESYLQPGSNLANILGFNSKTDAGNQDFQYVSTNTLTYQKTFASKHSVSALAGQEFTKNSTYFYTLEGRNLPTVSLTTIENAGTPQTTSTSKQDFAIISYFANASYDYDKKYYLTLSGRRDGSSRFGKNNLFSDFWAIGTAWNIKREKFMENVRILDELKLKASLGTSGNVPAGFYTSLGTYSFGTRYNNIPTAIPANLPNPDLTWEKNKNFDIGIEFSFFKRRIFGGIDYFSRTTDDLLFPRNISLTTGFSSVSSNVGSIRNKGIEITLGGDIIRTKDLTWNVTVNYTNTNNKVLSLVSDNIISNSTRFKVGESLNTFFLVRHGGVNPANGKNQFIKLDGTLTETYSASDAVLLSGKSPLATYFGGVSTSVRYKEFDLSLQFYYSGGNYIYNNVYATSTANGSRPNVNLYTAAANTWTKVGDIAEFPNLADPTQRVNNQHDKFLEKGDYLSLRDLVVGYNVSSRVLNKIKMKGLRFFVQGTNLWVNTKFNGIPEVGFPSREQGAGTFTQPGEFNLYGFPPSRIVTVGLDIRF